MSLLTVQKNAVGKLLFFSFVCPKDSEVLAFTMQDRDYRTVLDDFDPYIDELERAELGESKVLIKNELYMPVHISRDWIKCFVTSTQQDGFRYRVDFDGSDHTLLMKFFCHICIGCILRAGGVFCLVQRVSTSGSITFHLTKAFQTWILNRSVDT